MYADLNNAQITVDTSNDSVIIVDRIATIRGGRTLDVTNFPLDVIFAGHPIIVETSTDVHKPLPLVVKGGVTALGAFTPGSGYTNNGTYSGVALTGGSGSGATANITVAGNVVTAVVLVAKGTGYKAGEILSAAAANIGTGGSGFAVSVVSTSADAITYGTLPALHTYTGALDGSILKSKPFAGILTQGTINPKAAYYDFATIAAAFKTAVPLIDQRAD